MKNSLPKFGEAVKNKMFPHFLVVFQWTWLVMSITFNMNFSVAVTGAVANGGFKVVMFFHLWMLLVPVVLCLMFYRIRTEGIAERGIIGLSLMTLLFSMINVSLHFVDNLVLLMKATEVAAWSLYNGVFALSIYKISTEYLLLKTSRAAKSEREAPHNHKKLST